MIENTVNPVIVGNWFRTIDCKGGLIFFNLTDPTSPNLLGCADMDGYVHDVSGTQ